MSSSTFSFSLFRSLVVVSLIFSAAKAVVPPSETFSHVNQGEFGSHVLEYYPDYRPIGVGNSHFQLYFYNHTPDAFTLALRMTNYRTDSIMRLVWEANRGRPVRENATFSLGSDGNLVLADVDGSIAFQSNTANKGVVGLKVLPNGNMVLYDAKGKFIWQSFDYVTDTLLVGQSLRVGGQNKLASRASMEQNIDGRYSFVLEPKRLVMYYKGENSPKPAIYYTSSRHLTTPKSPYKYMKLTSVPETEEGFAYDQTLNYEVANSDTIGKARLARPKYNATLAFLRLDMDGNLRLYTFYDDVDYLSWEETFTLFSRDSDWENECQLPNRCGKFGVCEDNQCVACPTPNGSMGWSKDCAPKKLTSCKASDITYYKIEGVDHFTCKYKSGSGPMKVNDCEKKCTSDCKCLGYFYHHETSRCWVAYDLMTLTKVSESTHVGYIKTPKN